MGGFPRGGSSPLRRMMKGLQKRAFRRRPAKAGLSSFGDQSVGREYPGVYAYESKQERAIANDDADHACADDDCALTPRLASAAPTVQLAGRAASEDERSGAARVRQRIPGASTRREHERRQANREKRVREKHPRDGGLMLALGSAPTRPSGRAAPAGGARRQVPGEVPQSRHRRAARRGHSRQPREHRPHRHRAVQAHRRARQAGRTRQSGYGRGCAGRAHARRAVLRRL